MKLLKNSAQFEILTSPESFKEQLLAIEVAGRTCHKSQKDDPTDESAANFIRRIAFKLGHFSILEHGFATVKFTCVSRGMTHELVRHRLAGYSQEATRYVDTDDLHFIVPPHKDEHVSVRLVDVPGDVEPEHMHSPTESAAFTSYVGLYALSLAQMVEVVECFYRSLRKAGWKPEDARQILPIGTEAPIVATYNFRQWRHVFNTRTSKPAHWEVRAAMIPVLLAFKKLAPVIFEDYVCAGRCRSGVPYYEGEYGA